jgi:hypothetical protein
MKKPSSQIVLRYLASLAVVAGVAMEAHAEAASRAGVYPGTQRRFLPGFVYHVNAKNVTDFEKAAREVLPYKTKWLNPNERTGLFVSTLANWRQFYVDGNVKPKNPTDPNDQAYTWKTLDDILNSSLIAPDKIDGISLRLLTGNSETRSHPQWAVTEGNVWTCPANKIEYPLFWNNDWQLMKDLKDFLTAFGKRYKDNPRLHILQFPENIWATNACKKQMGHSANKCSREVAERCVHAAKVMPNTIILTGGIGDTTGGGAASIVDLVANQVGGFMPDPRFFRKNNGTKLWPEVTCDWSYGWMQKNAVKVPMGYATEPNGWWSDGFKGAPNPFGYKAGENPPMVGTIGAQIALWYVSGEPRGPIKDSKLGQAGDDPGGIIPSSWFYFNSYPWSKKKYPSLEDWDAAFQTFAWGQGKGTNAFPYVPPGFDLKIDSNDR